MRKAAAVLTLALLASGCVSGPKVSGGRMVRTDTVSKPPPVQTVPAASSAQFRAPTMQRIAGLDAIIGQNATGLANLFGGPRLDVAEGDARKLQFSGRACVMDVYLYPLQPGGEPRATHVETRRASDGREVDRASCAAALKR